ncbi:MAG: hypothetical protein HQK49_22820 [Oligoflexia bacterium]|nr:hypothetical protein [Oligoflexia bacterium]
MSLAQALSTYVTLNILIMIVPLSLLLLIFFINYSYSKYSKYSKCSISAKSLLNLHYKLLALIIVITIIHPLLPHKDFFKPRVAAKVWSAQSIKTFSKDYTATENGGYLSLFNPSKNASISANHIKMIWIILGSIILFSGIIKIVFDLHKLFIIRKDSYLIKKYKKISILAHDGIKVPFSYWLPGQANIIVPTSILGNKNYFKISLLHELQHHRNGDTRWIYVIWFMRLIAILNPFIHYWNRKISELQEFACDEALVDQKKVDSQAYARCLFEVAKSALDQKGIPVCATGLTLLVGRQLLNRRIEKMYKKNSLPVSLSVNFIVTLLITFFMATIAFASRELVQDRRISKVQALKMVEEVSKANPKFPVIVNDLVLKELNRYVGTPEGREFMKNSLMRMENYKKSIELKFEEYGIPEEFLAIPIVESGYQNLAQTANQVVEYFFCPSNCVTTFYKLKKEMFGWRIF